MFCESFGLLPQLYIIRKSKDSGDLSQLYVVFLAIARFLRLFFWIAMFFQGGRFFSLITADIIHCLALSNFVYNVMKNWSGRGLPTTFPEFKENTNNYRKYLFNEKKDTFIMKDFDKLNENENKKGSKDYVIIVSILIVLITG